MWSTSAGLRAHEKTHQAFDPSNYFYCEHCPNKFRSKPSLDAHVKQRHVLKIRFFCPQCPGRSWARKDHMKRHIRVLHLGIKEFNCEW
jgi:hypothetical protein